MRESWDSLKRSPCSPRGNLQPPCIQITQRAYLKMQIPGHTLDGQKLNPGGGCVSSCLTFQVALMHATVYNSCSSLHSQLYSRLSVSYEVICNSPAQSLRFPSVSNAGKCKLQSRMSVWKTVHRCSLLWCEWEGRTPYWYLVPLILEVITCSLREVSSSFYVSFGTILNQVLWSYLEVAIFLSALVACVSAISLHSQMHTAVWFLSAATLTNQNFPRTEGKHVQNN